MSAPAKGSALRLILPKDASSKILASLGSTMKMESKETVLTAGRLTTDDIVKEIKEYARLRDELLHTTRLLGIPREPQAGGEAPPDYARRLSEAQRQLDSYRARYQELQSRIEALGRELDETMKQLSKLAELGRTGFGPAEVSSRGGEFTRILGRMPVRRLDVARRTLENTLGEQAILALGRRSKDWVYILLAVQPDRASHALQTLMLYDFAQTEIPKSEEPDLNQAQASLEGKKQEIGKELGSATEGMKVFQAEARETLNRLADDLQDSLMLLRGVLKMGEGSDAVRAFAWLPKGPAPKTLNTLTNMGVLFEAE
jgi:vacuolar-type H+-ATPase subunit I/STV1